MTYRSFISIVLAAAIAVTSVTAAPAQAGGRDDAAKWIAGVAALAIIGAAIADDRRDKKRAARQRSYTDHDQYKNHGHAHNHSKKKHYNNGYGHKNHYKSQRRHNPYALPAQCRRQIHTRHGDIRGYGRKCLLDNYSSFNTLPHDCVVQGWNSNGKKRSVYHRRCVRNYGYYTAGER